MSWIEVRSLVDELERAKPQYTRDVVIVPPEVAKALLGEENPSLERIAEAVVDTADERAERYARQSGDRDARLPAIGETIVKEHAGKEYHVTMLESGFLHDGEEYGSLSAIAKKITGAKACNGYVFFGLTEPRRAPDNDPPVVSASEEPQS
jgi:hypothetical protein